MLNKREKNIDKSIVFFIVIAFLLIFNSDCPAQTSYPELGATIGAPAFFNVGLGYWIGPVNLRLSGMYPGGAQFNINYKVADDGERSHCVGIAVASSRDCGCDWSYLAPVYNYYYYDFFIEAGLAKVIEVRRGDFSETPYWPIFQIGYMWRFPPKSD